MLEINSLRRANLPLYCAKKREIIMCKTAKQIVIVSSTLYYGGKREKKIHMRNKTGKQQGKKSIRKTSQEIIQWNF